MKILQFLNRREIVNLLGWRIEVPLWVILVVIFSAFTVFKVRYQSLQGQWRTYNNNRYGYSIDYPANWLVRDYGSAGSKNLDFLSSSFIDLFTSSVHIHVKELTDPDFLEVIKWGEDLNQYAYNWSEVEMILIGQGRYEAMVRTHSTRNGILGRRNTFKVYYVVTENQAIALEFDPHTKNYDDRPDAFDHMLKSFHLIDIGKQE